MESMALILIFAFIILLFTVTVLTVALLTRNKVWRERELQLTQDVSYWQECHDDAAERLHTSQLDKQILITKAREDSVKRSRAGIKGRVGEQFVPFSDHFKHNASDARFIGSPIDFVVFDNYSNVKDGENDDEVTVTLVEIKYGSGSLSKAQRRIRDAIKEGRVRWEEIKLD